MTKTGLQLYPNRSAMVSIIQILIKKENLLSQSRASSKINALKASTLATTGKIRVSKQHGLMLTTSQRVNSKISHSFQRKVVMISIFRLIHTLTRWSQTYPNVLIKVHFCLSKLFITMSSLITDIITILILKY